MESAPRVEQETRWEDLIEFKETEPLRDPAPAERKTVIEMPRWLWPTAAGLLLMALIIAWAMVLRFRTANGTSLLENVPQTAKGVFSPAIDRSPFTILTGEWHVEGDELVQTDATRSYTELLFGDKRWTDYDFMVDVMRGGGGNSFSLFFRSTDRYNEYNYVVSGDDKYPCTAEVRERGQTSRLYRYDFSIQDRRWYTARVRVRRDYFLCSLYDKASGSEIPLFEFGFHDERHQKGRSRAANVWFVRPIQEHQGDGARWESAVGRAAGGRLAVRRSLWLVAKAQQPSVSDPVAKKPSSPESITNSIGMTLKLIPAGEFVMGSPRR